MYNEVKNGNGFMSMKEGRKRLIHVSMKTFCYVMVPSVCVACLLCTEKSQQWQFKVYESCISI